MRTVVYTILALAAFAANSVLCRVALHSGSIDPASFSSIRFAFGAVTLLVISALARSTEGGTGGGPTDAAAAASGSWASAGVLFLYAVPFSFAYTELDAGTGALILFGSVQIAMMLAALWGGERPQSRQWVGLGLAMAGLVYLVLPGLAAPSSTGAALMALSGIAWGWYSLRGRGASDPLAQTISNFLRLVPLLLGVSLIARNRLHVERGGVFLAMASGGLATGLGYVVWYRALKTLAATQAAVVQLAVPILAAAGGVILLAETLSGRLVGSAALVLGGLALAIPGRTEPVAVAELQGTLKGRQ